MSHFYSSVGSKGTMQTKCGNKEGMWCHIRGWNKGIHVEIWYDEKKQKDCMEVYLTGGSNGGREKLIGRYEE